MPWQSDNATESTIEAFGLLPASGSKTITPTASTTFTLVAKGPGGTQDASARVAVTRGGLRFGSIANGGADQAPHAQWGRGVPVATSVNQSGS